MNKFLNFISLQDLTSKCRKSSACWVFKYKFAVHTQQYLTQKSHFMIPVNTIQQKKRTQKAIAALLEQNQRCFLRLLCGNKCLSLFHFRSLSLLCRGWCVMNMCVWPLKFMFLWLPDIIHRYRIIFALFRRIRTKCATFRFRRKHLIFSAFVHMWHLRCCICG